MHDITVDVRKPMMPPLIFERHSSVIDPKAMQKGGVQIVHVHSVSNHVVAVVVGLTESGSAIDSAARQPDSETSRVMVSTVILGSQFSLAVNRAAEFSAPNNQRVFQ